MRRSAGAIASTIVLAAGLCTGHQTGLAQSAGKSITCTLDECLEMALRQSRRKPAAQFTVAMAEAQHRQALAGYWPQVNFKGGLQRMDEPLNFVFPASVFPVPEQSVSVPAGTAIVTIPAGAFAPGFPPSPIQMPVDFPAQTFRSPASRMSLPEQNIKVLDRDMALGTADMKWLLFDGGMRKGYRQQSGGWLQMMREEARRTDLEISESVKRYYWGAVLARQLRQLGDDTLARMEVTLRLTETLYKEGSEKVTKADYLDNQVFVETVRALTARLEQNETMAESALANAAGMSWNQRVRPADNEIPFEPHTASLEEMVGASYQFNPDWTKVEQALRAAEGAVTTARSGYYPKIALTGELHRWWNGGYRTGMATSENRAGWTAGLGMEVPLFDGFLTKNRIDEARARVNQIKQMQLLLKDGLGLQVKDIAVGLDAALKADRATGRAMKSAQENLDLNTRAYEQGLVETEKVLRAQMSEALMSAQHYAARYEYTALLARLNLIVGTELRRMLGGKPAETRQP